MIREPRRKNRRYHTFAESRHRALCLVRAAATSGKRQIPFVGSLPEKRSAACRKHAGGGSHAKNQRQLALARTSIRPTNTVQGFG